MKLTDLEPRFLHRSLNGSSDLSDEIAGADGVMFVCPKCYRDQGNSRPGVHSIICWTPKVPQTVSPTPGRWEMLGTGFHDLTLRAGSSSVHLTGPGCGAHFFITNGEILFA